MCADLLILSPLKRTWGIRMKKIKEILTRNISLKILSFLLAALLWVSIMNFNDPYITETITDIKVDVINKYILYEKDKLFEIESGEYVSVTVRGKRTIIDTLKASDFIAFADFTQLSFVNAVPIQVYLNAEANNYTSDDVEIQIRNPEVMTLTMEDLVEDLFNIEVVIEGEPAEGFYINNVVTKTNTMMVKATKKQLDKIAKIAVTIDAANADKSFIQTVIPAAYDESGNELDSVNITYEYAELKADIEVLPTKKINILTTQEGNPPDGYVCTGFKKPSDMTVTIAGTEEELAGISSYLITEIDVNLAVESIDYTIYVEDELKMKYKDKNLIVIDNETLNVRAIIEKLETKELMIKTSMIEFINLSEGYRARFLAEAEIRVKVRGLSKVLEGVAPETLKPYIDMKGKEIGTHYLNVLSNTRAEIEVYSPFAMVEVYEIPEDD